MRIARTEFGSITIDGNLSGNVEDAVGVNLASGHPDALAHLGPNRRGFEDRKHGSDGDAWWQFPRRGMRRATPAYDSAIGPTAQTGLINSCVNTPLLQV